MSQPVDTFTTQNQIDSYLNTLSKKYLANNAVVLSGTNSGIVSASVQALTPWANLSNRYFPTVAQIIEQSSNLKTRGELGGYFLPSNLGASVYLTKNIVYTLNADQIQNGSVYEVIEPSRFNKGRGLTKTDQSNVITHTIDINWIKPSNVSDFFTGNIVNADTYQKFIPYQSFYETTKSDSNGVVNARYDFEFWGGDKKQFWLQINDATKLNDLKYFDLSARINSLVLTPGKELYAWNADVFGNQYALYKDIINPRSLYDSMTAAGLLWVKTINDTISVGPSALNDIYKSYVNTPLIYNQLINNTIVNFEVFFDTLVIQLANTVLFEKITFDYDNYTIKKSLQNFTPLSAGPDTSSKAFNTVGFETFIGTPSPNAVTYFGGNWYNTAEKSITVCTLLSTTFTGKTGSLVDTSGVSSILVPVLYKLDLNNPQERKRIFPLNETSPNTFIEYVHPLGRINYMEAPVFCYNDDTKLYLTTFIAFISGSQAVNLINYKITA